MKLIPQMFSDATLQARYRDAIRRKITLRPGSTSAAELERDIATVVTEQGWLTSGAWKRTATQLT